MKNSYKTKDLNDEYVQLHRQSHTFQLPFFVSTEKHMQPFALLNGSINRILVACSEKLKSDYL
ncbi:hypothetical protein [Pontibacter arcticus]|uniref:hypothetical protein n=1 Tax=Pontibacter arcticus TaxID=2080288 RepID=UPI000F61F13C|nr:hypothetical protein [Pontibacter arcticus]